MLGARIRQFRQAKGWSQEELGLRAGYDRSSIQKMEAGEAEPLIGKVLDVTRTLGQEPSDVLGGDVWNRIVARTEALDLP